MEITYKQLHAAWKRFQRTCRVTKEAGRYRKAWRVGGTQENGTDTMYRAQLDRMKGKL